MKSRIGLRLVISIVLFSSLITLVSTGLRIYADYRGDLRNIESYMGLIRQSYLQSLSSSLWQFDDEQIRIQLNGLVHLPDMEYLEIRSEEGNFWAAGEVQSEHLITNEFPLTHVHAGEETTIGSLRVAFSLDNVYQRLLHKTLTILVNNAIKTFLVSGFTLLIFHFFVTRHLTQLAAWLHGLKDGVAAGELRLHRPARPAGKEDELDAVVRAMNGMQTSMRIYLADLVKSENRYKTLTENIPVKIFHKDRSSVYVACNKNYADDLHISPEQIEGKTDYDFHPPDLADKYRQDDGRVMESGATSLFEEEYVLDSRRIIIQTVKTPLRDDAGKVIGILGVFRDISARKKAEDELKNSNALLNAIIEGTTDAVFLKDLEGRYLMANQSTCQAIGRPRREIIGRNDRELFAAASAAVIVDVDESVMRSGTTRLAEEKIATAYGEETYWLTNKSPYRDKDGNIVGLIGISRNITDIRKAEKEKNELQDRLRQAEKMEAIGTLAGGIAHDFNNILAAIIGYAELAREDLADRNRLLADIDEILHGALRAGDLVKQILTFSRKGREELQPLEPAPVVREALRLMRASLPSTIVMQEEIDGACGCIMADPTHIHQVLVNLCTNASHALPDEQGIIKIRLARVDMPSPGLAEDSGAGTQPFVELTVSDTGHGMSGETRERIFEPYFTTKEVGKGSGMGLAVVHGIVQSSGGFINVESEPGKGTTFRVYFPVVAAEQTAEAAGKECGPLPGGTERILVIDDEERIVALQKAVLTRLGYQVTAMTDSRSALALFLSAPEDFDLIVTDQTMPVIPGSELSERIVQARPDMRIILCTGYSSMISEDKARQIGIKRFLMKPVSGTLLARIVREVLDG
jgi:PAS domain S-box-containing protein